MTTDDELERRLQAYLEAGPTELADGVLWAARAQLQTTRRRSARLAGLAPWRDFRMNQSTRLLIAGGAALALVVAIGAGILGRPAAGPGSTGAPSISGTGSVAPVPSATPAGSTFAFPVRPDQSVEPLSAAWETMAGAPTTFGLPEVAPDGRIWVASSIDGAFRILTPDGKVAETWGTPGVGDGQFNFGEGGGGAVAFAPDGGFWVVDTGNFRVQRFAKDRTFLSSWGRFGSGAGEFSDPVDITVDDRGTVFVGDDRRRDVQAFTSDGTFLRALAPGQFVQANGDGWLMTNVLPDGRSGIVEYKPDGTIQGGIDMPVLLPQVLGMTRDAADNIYVVGLNSAGDAGKLLRFDVTGGGPEGWNVGGIGVAVSPDGTAAYVLEPSSRTIGKFVLPRP